LYDAADGSLNSSKNYLFGQVLFLLQLIMVNLLCVSRTCFCYYNM